MTKILSYWGKTPKRITKVIIGDTYSYQPINPAATRDRGRQGILLAYNSDPFMKDPFKNATVKWTDSKRTSIVDIERFIHVSDLAKSSEQLESEARSHIEARVEQMQK